MNEYYTYDELIKIQNSEPLKAIAKKIDAWVYLCSNKSEESLIYDRGEFVKKESDPSNGDASSCSFDNYNYKIQEHKLVVKCTYTSNRDYDELLKLHPDLDIKLVKEKIKDYFINDRNILTEQGFETMLVRDNDE